MAYQIIGYQGSPITGAIIYSILCDTVADLPSGTISGGGQSGPITQGCSAKIIENGAEYLANSSGEWVKQKSGNAWENVYTKDEIDAMTTATYECMMYYHSAVESSDGTVTFYTFDDSIGHFEIYGNVQQGETPKFVGVKTANLISFPTTTITVDTLTVVSNEDSITISGNASTVSGSNTAWKQFDFTLDAGEYTLSLGEPRVGQNGYAARLYKYDDSSAVCDFLGAGLPSFKTFTLSERTHVYLGFYIANKSLSNDKWVFMLNTGSTPMPYGYEIPITCGGQTTSIFIGEPLRKATDGSNAVDVLYSTGTITRAVGANGNALATPTTQTITVPTIPTVSGGNTFTVDTEVPPSKIIVSGEEMYTKSETDAMLDEKANKASVVPLVNQAQKNLMKLSGSDVTGYGIRCTFDYEAGTITLDGINTDKKCTGSFNIQAADSRVLGLEEGTVYHFSCDGYQTNNDTIGLYVYTSGATPVTQFDCFTNNEQAWNPAWEQASGFRLFIRQGTVVDNVVLKPMICTKENYDLTSQFEPYTPTLHELYAMILQLQAST